MLKLVSLNIERSKHLDRVIPFLREQNADVVCLQELCEVDIPRFAEVFGDKKPLFSPATREKEDTGRAVVHGLGIYSRLPILGSSIRHYSGDPNVVPDTDDTKSETFQDQNHSVVFCDVEKAGEKYRVGVTHFTWSPKGQPTDTQRAHMKKLLELLEGEREFTLVGDFNSPRGGEMFSMLAAKYHDNIPTEYLWSVDRDIHKAGRDKLTTNARVAGLPGLMVDGLFTTPQYAATDVRIISGLSDHCAVVAHISRASS